MSCEFLELTSRALCESVNLFGAPTFLYKGTSYPAVINDVDIAQVLQDGGLLETLLTIIVVSRNVLATSPNIGETVFANSKRLRIEKVKQDEVSFELHCTTAAV